MAKWIAVALLVIATIVFAISQWNSAGPDSTGTGQAGTTDAAADGPASSGSGDDRSSADDAATAPQIYEWDADNPSASGQVDPDAEPERTTYGVIEEARFEIGPAIDPAELPPEILETGKAPVMTVSPSAGSGVTLPPPQGYANDTSGPPPQLSNEVLPGPTGELSDALPAPGDVTDGSDMIGPDLPGPGPGSGIQDPPGLGPGETPPDGN